MSEIELFQFRRSHFNEKARWALDYKGIPHRRHSLLPGPHAATIKRLSGQKQVPVLKYGTEVIAGSAAILEELERRHPQPALLPSDAGERTRALEIQAGFDAEVGPAVRLAGFAEFLDDPAYFADLFSDDRSWAARTAYRAAIPLVRGVIVRDLDIRPETIAAALERTQRAFDFVHESAGQDDHLVGESFSIADLTAASLLMPAVNPEGGPGLPPPVPVQSHWLARWADHPGAAWVRRIYARHRGESAEIAA